MSGRRKYNVEFKKAAVELINVKGISGELFSRLVGLDGDAPLGQGG